eukprot:193043-Rhodomonas_salina.4
MYLSTVVLAVLRIGKITSIRFSWYPGSNAAKKFIRLQKYPPYTGSKRRKAGRCGRSGGRADTAQLISCLSDEHATDNEEEHGCVRHWLPGAGFFCPADYAQMGERVVGGREGPRRPFAPLRTAMGGLGREGSEVILCHALW